MLPQSVSHFEVFEKLGAGGMGTVYRARDIRLNRIVALKFLSPHLCDSETNRRRFLREGRTLSVLSHPHIATVFEVDEDKGIPFLALEYLSGGTLRERIIAANGNVPVATLVTWALGLAEGLAHAHRNGVLHRDVKSTNVIFDSEGRPKLTDFGLAKFTSGTDVSHTDPMVGTIGYIAPELLQGKLADNRSDLFSFGVLLYEATTGKSPFQGDSAARVLQRVLTEIPDPIKSVRPDIAPAMEAIVSRLLEKNPDDRYQSTDEVVRDLGTLRGMWADDQPTVTTLDVSGIAAALPKASTPTRRNWITAAGGLVLLAAGVFGVVESGIFAPATDLTKQHLAVLPFQSSGGENLKAFSDGLTETITGALTNYSGVSLVPAVDARKLTTSEEARREHGVTLVISGTVTEHNGQVKITINLIDAVERKQRRSEEIDGPVNELFDLEDGVVARVTSMLSVRANPQQQEQLAASGSTVSKAQEAFVRGRGYLYRYDQAGNLDRAIQAFEFAKQEDPQFAAAFVGIAECQFRKAAQLREPTLLVAARLSAERALQINPKLASAHIWLGRIFGDQGFLKEAEEKLRAGVRLDPKDPEAYRGLARLYQRAKRPADAESIFKQAIAARPGDWTSYSGLANFYAAQHRYGDAETQFRKVIDLTPDNASGHRNLGTVLQLLGKNQEAERALKQSIDLRPGALAYSNLGAILMMQGRNGEAVGIMESAVKFAAIEQQKEYRIWGNLGDVYWLTKAPPEKSQAAWRAAATIAESQLASKAEDPALLLSMIAKYRAKLGEQQEAQEKIQEAIRLAPANPTVRFQSGMIAALVGNKNQALAELEMAAGLGYATEEISKAPEFAPLKNEPRFQQLLQQFKAH